MIELFHNTNKTWWNSKLDFEFQAAHAEKIGATAIGVLPNMFTFPQNVDQLVEWVKEIASAAPNTPCLYYHIPKNTKVECKHFKILLPSFSRSKYKISFSLFLNLAWINFLLSRIEYIPDLPKIYNLITSLRKE